MGFQYFAGAAYRALTARKDGPSLYDVCDPLLLRYARRRPASRQILSDRARQSGAAAAAAPDRAARTARRARGCKRLRAGADRGRATTTRRTGPRSAQPVAELMDDHRCRPSQAARRRRRPARAPDLAEIERVDPQLRRASAALVRQERLHPDLCRLQPARRPRHGRARIADGADRAEFARLQELDAAVQPGADLHRAFAGARADQPALAAASPSRCGSRCRSAIARPITTRSSPRRC